MIPPDIFRHLKKAVAKERAIRRTREQVRRVRVLISDASGRCATPAALNDLPVTPVGCFIAAPQSGQSRFAPVTGDKKPFFEERQ